MNKRRSLVMRLAALAFFVIGATVVEAQSQQRIQLSQLEVMFAQMRAKAPWNVDGPLLWGYFFYDASQEKLQDAAKELLTAKYRVVTLSKVPEGNTFRLHVEKIEVHSTTSLHARNSELYELAAKYKLASYDGMDVGPVPK